MKTLVLKLLGLDTLTKENETLKKGLADLEVTVLKLGREFDELEAKLDDLKDTVEEIEIPEMDDYATHDWVMDEINDQIDTDRIVEECVEKLEDEIEEKVRDLFNDASPAPMSEEAIKEEIKKSLADVLSKVYDLLKR